MNMSSITNDEIRHGILEILYKFAQENPSSIFGNKKAMHEALQISEKRMDFNMLYLEQKVLVKLFKTLGALWSGAEITAYGIDVIEDKDKYSKQFPFIQTTIQEIYGDIYGTVVQAVGSQVNFNQQVTSAFKQARDMTKAKEDIPPKLREEIEKNLDLLEEELKRKESDAGKIQKMWKWLKRNANWVVPALTQVVLEGVKIALG